MPKTAEERRKAWLGYLRMVNGWRTRTDVACSSANARYAAYAFSCREVERTLKEHGDSDWDGREELLDMHALLKWSCAQHLHTPRVYFLQGDLAGVRNSAWGTVQTSDRDGAYVQFLGLPKYIFDELLADFVRPSPVGGRYTKLMEADCLALALRYMTTTGTLADLELDFGTAHTVIQRELWLALMRLRVILKATPEAQCRMPDLERAKAQEAGARMQHGPPPEDCDFDVPCVLLIDGSVLAIHAVSNKEEQAKYAYRKKGYVVNNVFCFDLEGCIVMYKICAIGVANDSAVAKPMFEKLNNPAFNPHKLGIIVDNGFKVYTNNGADGRPAVHRPLGKETILVSEAKRLERWSAYVVRRRQANEWANGALKRSWPRILVPMTLKNIGKFQNVLEVAIYLQNFRTRRVGFNQLKTTYMRHVDMNFREQLAAGRSAGGSKGLDLYFSALRATAKGEAEAQRLTLALE